MQLKKRLFTRRVILLPICNCVLTKVVLLILDYSFLKNILLSSYLLQQTFLFFAFLPKSGAEIKFLDLGADRKGAAHPAESEVMKTRLRLIQVDKTDVVIIIKIRKKRRKSKQNRKRRNRHSLCRAQTRFYAEIDFKLITNLLRDLVYENCPEKIGCWTGF